MASRLRRRTVVLASVVTAAHAIWPLPAAADEGRLTLRGQLDAAVSLLRGLDGRMSHQLVSDVGGASFLAIEAVEPLRELGAGWSAQAILDAGLQTDTGRGRVNNDPGTPTLNQANFSFNRRAVVGLTAPWGQVLLGRDYHALPWSSFAVDPLGLRFWGNLAGVMQIQSGRFNNGLYYASPLLDGWRVRASIGLGDEAAAPQARGDGRSLGLAWRSGPWAFDAAWLREATGGGPSFALPSATSHITTWLAGLSLGTPDRRVSLGSSRLSGSGDSRGYHRDAVWLGGNTTLGAQLPNTSLHLLLASTRSRPGQAITVSLSLEQRLSLRSAVYASCGRARNDALSNVSLAAAIPQLGALGPAAVTGVGRGISPAACSAGMRHAF